jgi:lipopolysaccharide transport system ATP-binding protein
MNPLRRNPNDNPADEPLIRVSNVGKVFCRDLRKSLLYGASDTAWEFLGRQSGRKRGPEGSPILRDGEFWANKGISFELRRGECLGLVGRNGAGKTTLLKMLNGLIKPDEGLIEIRGRVGAIIALGAGFNPVLTGRENVYVNAALLGLSRSEIDARFPEIVEFSGIGRFIDSPVQCYSSGMQVRLGFAIATSTQPDVLLLDEVLAVGDQEFQSKCMVRISSLVSKCAVIFVSHQEHLVQRLCDRAVWLADGRVAAIGETSSILAAYLEAGHGTDDKRGLFSRDESIAGASATLSRKEICSGENLEVVLEIQPATFGLLEDLFISLVDNSGKHVCRGTLSILRSMSPGEEIRCAMTIRDLRLKSGSYWVQILAFRDGGKTQLIDLYCNERVRITSPWISKVEYQPHVELDRIDSDVTSR